MSRPQTIAQNARHCPSPPSGNLGNVDFMRLLGRQTSVAQVAQQLFENRSGQLSKKAMKSMLPSCPGCPPSTRGCRCRATAPASLGGDRRPAGAWRLTSVTKHSRTRSNDRQWAGPPRAETQKVNARIRDCSNVATLTDRRQCVGRDPFKARAALREYDGRLSRTEAEAIALLGMAQRWRCHNPFPDSDRSARCHCGGPASDTPILGGNRRVWLHADCGEPLNEKRQREALDAVTRILNAAKISP